MVETVLFMFLRISLAASGHEPFPACLKAAAGMAPAKARKTTLNDMIASLGYRICSWFENKYPDKAARWWSYRFMI